MIEVRARSCCSSSWILMNGESELGEVAASWSRPSGTVKVGGQLYTVERSKSRGAWKLLAGTTTVLEAMMPKKSNVLFEIPVEGDSVRLVPEGWDRRRFLVTNDQGTILGRIDRGSWMRRRAAIEMPPDMPLTVQAFLFQLVLCYWAGQASA